MSIKPNGGAAFPLPEKVGISTGMSLRDWFAGMALLGLLSSTHQQTRDEVINSSAKAACWAYEYADAMIEQRNKNDDE